MKMPLAFLLSIKDYMLPCLNKKLFGIECPGCGLQRAVLLLFEGDFIGAFKMYPAVYTLIPFFGFLLVNHFYTLKYANKIIITLTVFNIVIILTNYILKFI